MAMEYGRQQAKTLRSTEGEFGLASDYRRVQGLQAKLRSVRAGASRAKDANTKAEREFGVAQSQYNDWKEEMERAEEEAHAALRKAMERNRRMKDKLARETTSTDQQQTQLDHQLAQAKTAHEYLSMQLESVETASLREARRRNQTLKQVGEETDGAEEALASEVAEVKKLQGEYASLSDELRPWTDKYNRQLQENDVLSRRSKELVVNLTKYASTNKGPRKETDPAPEELPAPRGTTGAQDGATDPEDTQAQSDEAAGGITEEEAERVARLKEELRVGMRNVTRLHMEKSRMEAEAKELDQGAADTTFLLGAVQTAVPQLRQFVTEVEDAVTAELADLEQMSYTGP